MFTRCYIHGKTKYSSGLSLCDKIQQQHEDEEVTEKICYDSSNMDNCEVYAEEGEINGIYIDTCMKFCKAYGLRCSDAFENGDKCQKDLGTPTYCATEFTKPSSSLIGTKDNICSCANIGKALFLSTKSYILKNTNGVISTTRLNFVCLFSTSCIWKNHSSSSFQEYNVT